MMVGRRSYSPPMMNPGPGAGNGLNGLNGDAPGGEGRSVERRRSNVESGKHFTFLLAQFLTLNMMRLVFLRTNHGPDEPPSLTVNLQLNHCTGD